jgi:hypothetical protein
MKLNKETHIKGQQILLKIAPAKVQKRLPRGEVVGGPLDFTDVVSTTIEVGQLLTSLKRFEKVCKALRKN